MPNLFALKVDDDGLVSQNIMPGDKIVVQSCSTAKPGDTVVCLIGDKAILRQLAKREGRYYLDAGNPQYKPILVDERVSLLGRAVYHIQTPAISNKSPSDE